MCEQLTGLHYQHGYYQHLHNKHARVSEWLIYLRFFLIIDGWINPKTWSEWYCTPNWSAIYWNVSPPQWFDNISSTTRGLQKLSHACDGFDKDFSVQFDARKQFVCVFLESIYVDMNLYFSKGKTSWSGHDVKDWIRFCRTTMVTNMMSLLWICQYMCKIQMCSRQHKCVNQVLFLSYSGMILGMGSANERRRYYVTPSPIGRGHTQNDP